jgi:four helix bundle protein
MSYKELKVWQMARDLSADIHHMMMAALPQHEMYEEGSQIRRSIKSVRSNIVEGYGRRMYKQESIRFLVIAHASCDEALDHLETLHETGSLTDGQLFNELHSRTEELGRALGGFLRAVQSRHVAFLDPTTNIEPDS